MECRWHFAVCIALTESRFENHSITHFSLIIFNDHTLTAWYQVYIYIHIIVMITLLQRDVRTTHYEQSLADKSQITVYVSMKTLRSHSYSVMAPGVNIMISWSHSYSVMAVFCQYHDIMITLLQHDGHVLSISWQHDGCSYLRHGLAESGALVKRGTVTCIAKRCKSAMFFVLLRFLGGRAVKVQNVAL